MTRCKLIFFITVGVIAFSSPAHAYIDPGTGSMIVQAIIGSVVAGMTVVGLYYERFKMKVRMLLGKAPSNTSESANSDD